MKKKYLDMTTDLSHVKNMEFVPECFLVDFIYTSLNKTISQGIFSPESMEQSQYIFRMWP